MKPILLFFLGIISVYSQPTLVGKWKINWLVGKADTKEYVLEKGDKIPYGNQLTLNPDGTFISQYYPFCGNDVVTVTSGTYEIISDKRIRFVLKAVHKSGMGHKKEDLVFDKDLGIFLIQNDIASIKLIREN